MLEMAVRGLCVCSIRLHRASAVLLVPHGAGRLPLAMVSGRHLDRVQFEYSVGFGYILPDGIVFVRAGKEFVFSR